MYAIIIILPYKITSIHQASRSWKTWLKNCTLQVEAVDVVQINQ